MDLSKVLAELREELADLDAAIASLEQLPQVRPKRGDGVSAAADAEDARRQSMPAPAEANGRTRGAL
jgi:hypothetical protein